MALDVTRVSLSHDVHVMAQDAFGQITLKPCFPFDVNSVKMASA